MLIAAEVAGLPAKESLDPDLAMRLFNFQSLWIGFERRLFHRDISCDLCRSEAKACEFLAHEIDYCPIGIEWGSPLGPIYQPPCLTWRKAKESTKAGKRPTPANLVRYIADDGTLSSHILTKDDRDIVDRRVRNSMLGPCRVTVKPPSVRLHEETAMESSKRPRLNNWNADNSDDSDWTHVPTESLRQSPRSSQATTKEDSQHDTAQQKIHAATAPRHHRETISELIRDKYASKNFCEGDSFDLFKVRDFEDSEQDDSEEELDATDEEGSHDEREDEMGEGNGEPRIDGMSKGLESLRAKVDEIHPIIAQLKKTMEAERNRAITRANNKVDGDMSKIKAVNESLLVQLDRESEKRRTIEAELEQARSDAEDSEESAKRSAELLKANQTASAEREVMIGLLREELKTERELRRSVEQQLAQIESILHRGD